MSVLPLLNEFIVIKLELQIAFYDFYIQIISNFILK